MVQNVNDVTKYEKSEYGYTTTITHVGATGIKLKLLNEALTPKFDSVPAFKAKRTGWNNNSKGYFLQGKVGGVDYMVYIYCDGCPTPVLKTYIHEVLVTVPDGMKDELTPIIEREFQIYQSEVAEREKIVEEELPAMEAKIEAAGMKHKEQQEQLKRGLAVRGSVINRLNPTDE